MKGKGEKNIKSIFLPKFSPQISLVSLKLTTSQEFKVKAIVLKRRNRSRRTNDIFSLPGQFDIDRERGLIHHRSDVMGNQE